MQAYAHPTGSIMRVQLADGRILDGSGPAGHPTGRQIHFPVAAAPGLSWRPRPSRLWRARASRRCPAAARLCSRGGDDPSPTWQRCRARVRIKLTDDRV